MRINQWKIEHIAPSMLRANSSKENNNHSSTQGSERYKINTSALYLVYFGRLQNK